jgi:hypothetical protein
MSTRVWRQLAREDLTPPANDGVLRMALCAMAADPTSRLTAAERQEIIDLGHRTDRFTATERARFRAPLLAWVAVAMPRCRAIIAKQFDERRHL